MMKVLGKHKDYSVRITRQELLDNRPDPGKSYYVKHKLCIHGREDTRARMWVSNTGDSLVGYCHRCGEKRVVKLGGEPVNTSINLDEYSIPELPEDYTTDIPLAHKVGYLYKYYLTDDDISKMQIGWSEALQRIIFPVFRNEECVFWQGRAAHSGQKPKWFHPKLCKKRPRRITHPNSESVIVVEDWISAIRCSRIANVICLFGTHLNKEFRDYLISQYTVIYIWLDGDKAGRLAAKKLQQQLDTGINECYNIYSELDPKAYADQDIKEILKKG